MTLNTEEDVDREVTWAVTKESILKQLNEMLADKQFADIIGKGGPASQSYKEWKGLCDKGEKETKKALEAARKVYQDILDAAKKDMKAPPGKPSWLRKVPFLKILVGGAIALEFVDNARADGIGAASADAALDMAAPIAKTGIDKIVGDQGGAKTTTGKVSNLLSDVISVFTYPFKKLNEALGG